jgi:NO-binding membrane sensor protein with MHYT domain
VSWIGAWTTLELINKRAAGRGLYNWYGLSSQNIIHVAGTNPYRYLVVGSSISMGGIAIWGMHFLGNRAIILGDGDDSLQVAYNPGFSALSFFMPIIVFFTAFITLGSNEKVSWLRIGLGGALAGLAICGMHYLGQAGILNYSIQYMVGNIVGSAIIAVVVSTIALAVFFTLRATWTASWWNRALTASLLAGAVSGMHWVAEIGTQYRFKQSDTTTDGALSRNATIIVVIVLVWPTSGRLCEIVLTLAVCCGLFYSDHFLFACATGKSSLFESS